jgi:hypothetical protein
VGFGARSEYDVSVIVAAAVPAASAIKVRRFMLSDLDHELIVAVWVHGFHALNGSRSLERLKIASPPSEVCDLDGVCDSDRFGEEAFD